MEPRYNEGSRDWQHLLDITRFFFICFTITGLKKIVRYNENFVIQRFIISTFHFIVALTVLCAIFQLNLQCEPCIHSDTFQVKQNLFLSYPWIVYCDKQDHLLLTCSQYPFLKYTCVTYKNLSITWPPAQTNWRIHVSSTAASLPPR